MNIYSNNYVPRVARTAFQIAARWLIVCVALVSYEAFPQEKGKQQNPWAGAGTNEPVALSVRSPGESDPSNDYRFTTKAYNQEAFRLVLEEANRIAADLHLPEKLPITETDVTSCYITPYGFTRMGAKTIGVVEARSYAYSASEGYKLSYVDLIETDQKCIEWRDNYRWPLARIDTNGAYQLATQWLAAASMDVRALNRICQAQVEVNKFWNKPLSNTGTFVPIYDVSWVSPKNKADGYGDEAFVSLFAPAKTLISLRVDNSDYILRKPLVFTNLAELLSQTNAPARTNSLKNR